MTSMIERGAEAMRARRRELIAQPLERIWPDLMRAAIEAMRFNEDGSDCHESIRIAGEEAYYENGDARAIFNAMISAALKEQP